MEMLDNLMLTGCPMSHRQTPLTLQTSNPTFLTQMTISRGLGPQMYSKVKGCLAHISPSTLGVGCLMFWPHSVLAAPSPGMYTRQRQAAQSKPAVAARTQVCSRNVYVMAVCFPVSSLHLFWGFATLLSAECPIRCS